MKKEEIEAFFNTIAHFTNVRSIHSGFYQRKMIDDNQFYSAFGHWYWFFSWCTVKPKARLLHICPLSAQRTITVQDGAIALKGSYSMGDGRIFLKSLRDASFNKDLSNEPTFGWIHLAGQYH
jgi:hypothetical protein